MKKYWKIRNGSDIKQSLEFLNLPKWYIDILLEENSEFMKFLNVSRYVYITQSLINIEYENGFGWLEDEKFAISRNWIYAGEVNLRKQKLKKIELCKNEN